jgi:restriction system protein
MRIWTYRDVDINALSTCPNKCEYCAQDLNALPLRKGPQHVSWKREEMYSVSVCSQCGWWVLTRESSHSNELGWGNETRRAAGALLELDGSDIEAPTAELCRHLVKSYGDRFDVHPKKYDSIVGAVFRGAGFEVRATAYSGDKGIDLFVFDGPSDSVVGVQVKRYRGKIEAEQIRAFVGALVLAGVTRGIFVTTSEYRRGAIGAAADADRVGTSVELWDAREFYDRLSLSTRAAYEYLDQDDAPYALLLADPSRIPLVSTDGDWYKW